MTRTRGRSLSMILPARNEADLIGDSVRRVDAELARLGIAYEIVVSDSASDDATGERARETGLPNLRVVRSERAGKGRALSVAFAHARGTHVGFIDSDLEIDPSYIPAFVAALDAGYDAAIATKSAPAARRARQLRRRLGTDIYNRMVRRLLGTPYSDHQGGLKVFRREAIESVLPSVTSTGWGWDTEVLVRLDRRGCRIREVPVIPVSARGNRLGTIRVGIELLGGIARILVRQRRAGARARPGSRMRRRLRAR